MSRIFAVPDGIHSDAHPDYEAGRIDQLDADEREARILAFGAIRRAATLVRAHDELATILAKFPFSKREANRLRAESLLMRMTIRAAIGSDKP